MAQRFCRTDKNRTGNYCEALARAAFIADGANIALPAVGTQPGWDLLVEEESGWKKVQVKSAKPNKCSGAVVSLMRGGGKKRPCCERRYTSGSFDYLVAVLPETGTIWKMPVSAVAGKNCISLQAEGAWMNGEEKAELPAMAFANAYIPQKVPVLKRYLRENTGDERPEFASEENWDMLVRFRDGMSARAIGEIYHLNLFAVRGRIEAIARVIHKRGGPQPPPTVYGTQRGSVEGLRDRALKLMPATRPDYISESSWGVLVRWTEGESQRSIMGQTGYGVADRLWRAVKALERHEGK